MKKTLLFTNIITLIALLVIGYGLVHYRNLNIKNLNTCQYELSMFDFHYKQGPANYNIEMLGNSFIRAVSWDSLLNRTDVVNRGISGERLKCICERTVYLKNSPAKICFIEGGINDLPSRSGNDVFNDYINLVDSIKAQHKIPVINMVLYLSPLAGNKYPLRKDYKTINKTIQNINVKLKAYAVENNMDYIDLNKDLCDEHNPVLYDKYTLDGVHPNQAAYRIWARHIEDILKKHNI